MNTKQLVSVGVAIVVLGVGVWLWLGRSANTISDTISRAEGIIEQSRRENLIHIEQQAFDDASAAVVEAKRLAEKRDRGALTAAQSAVTLAEAARAAALGGIQVSRTAVLSAIKHEVLHRPGDALAWKDATKNMSLYDGDRIATRKNSAAIIKFTAGTETRVEEDSVVVVKRFVENRQAATINLELSVAEGSVRSVVMDEDGRTTRLSLDLPTADIVVDSSSDGRKVEIGTQVGADESARVSVFSGTAHIENESGEDFIVTDNQYLDISSSGEFSVKKDLPKAALALAPGNEGMVYVHPERPDVTFLWEAAKGCAVARIEVSNEPIFMDKVLDLTTEHSKLTAKLLSDGNYLWRVSCIDEAGVQGAYTESQRFTLVRDGEPPTLEILSPPPNATVTSKSIAARCRTESQAMVFINGEEAKDVGSGVYEHSVELNAGMNRIVFEVIDSAGNATHARQFVTRKDGS